MSHFLEEETEPREVKRLGQGCPVFSQLSASWIVSHITLPEERISRSPSPLVPLPGIGTRNACGQKNVQLGHEERRLGVETEVRRDLSEL